jgi:catechol 2,3-dioxygenase-like lactoylglutathione lyase family enzyme
VPDVADQEAKTMAADGPVFDQFNLVVSDMAATVEFYRLLGLEIPDTAPEWQNHHRTVVMGDGVDLDLDSAEFARKWNRGWPGRTSGSMGVLGFRLASRETVDELHNRLTAAGCRTQQAPYDAFWGARYAVVEDPDGNSVGLMSPADSAFRSAPELP